jgi:ABC-type multidrug transport system fused ATPase/permease subunit
VEQGTVDQLIAARGWFAQLAMQSAPDVPVA